MCDENEDDHLTDMINDAKDCFVDRPNELTKMLEKSEKPIYPGLNITKLSFLVRMYNLKTRNGWSDNELIFSIVFIVKDGQARVFGHNSGVSKLQHLERGHRQN